MADVTLDRVSKAFGTARAVQDVSMDIRSGEFVALLGPSGCGKTTLLRLLAGFERVDAGTIRIDGEPVSGHGVHVAPERRRIGMVFQSYALWPHMTVAENVGFPLKVGGIPARQRQRRIAEALAAVGLQDLARRRPAALSGGQRQRVALARCLVMEPRLVLLDEPLANLDAHLREAMQEEFRNFHRQTGATLLYVTHDQAEALALADRVAVMMDGCLQQIAPPQVLYREPATPAVARFIGRGMVVPVTVTGPADAGRCRAEVLGLPVVLRSHDTAPGPRLACLRPEDIALAGDAGPGLTATVVRTSFQGASTLVEVALDGLPGQRLCFHHPAPPAHRTVRLCITDGWVIPERVQAGHTAHPAAGAVWNRRSEPGLRADRAG